VQAAAGPAIELREVGRDYGERAALRDVSASLPAGATLAVLGPNGAGKTTLLRVLAGLLEPHAGSVRVLGRELPRRTWEIRGRIGYVGHRPLLYRDLTARENLRYHARLHRVAEGRAGQLLEQAGLSPHADRPAAELSRGLLQRVDLCRAVLHEPEVLLLDEPLSGLDPGAVEVVTPLIGRGRGLTRVVTGNDPAASLEQADVALGLRAGRVAVSGPAAEVDGSAIEALYR
jgi:heme exporter protein A